MNKYINYTFLFAASFYSHMALADLVQYTTQKISGIRSEGNVALFSFQNLPAASTGCKDRVWMSLTDDAGRSQYSLGIAAFMSGKSVLVRAHNDTSLKMHTECKLYDIYVTE